MKRWTYAELTATTEKNIRQYMDIAEHKPDFAEMYRDWAFGSYSLWADITADEKEASDWERLKKLVGLD